MTMEIDLMHNFRSKFEKKCWGTLIKKFPDAEYEPDFIKYMQPEIERTYNPDFKPGTASNIYIEAKGKLDLETRKKMVFFKQSHPEIHIVFLFMNPDVKIRKGSKTTYGMWATKQEFDWLDSRKDWIDGYNKLCTERGW